jgi:hypothetical protein
MLKFNHMRQRNVPQSFGILFFVFTFCLVSSCKRTGFTEQSNAVSSQTRQTLIQSNEDSAALINYVASFSNLLNRNNFKEYFLTVKDKIRPFKIGDEIDPILRDGMFKIIQNDKSYQNELAQFSEQSEQLNASFNIKNFTREDWEKVMRSAHKAGIYLFPDVAKKKDLETQAANNSQARSMDTPCADAYDAYEMTIGGTLIGLAGTCWGMGLSWAGLICWGALAGVYQYLQNDLEDSWCRCMHNTYGACLY